MKLAYFDAETTGTDPYKDRIVELAILVVVDGVVEAQLDTLVNPQLPIPEEASEIHGITDEMVANAPTMQDIAEEVWRMVEGTTLVGYNIRRFDTPLLATELSRCGLPGGKLLDQPEIDLYRLWMECEPRTLEGAFQRFLGREMDGEAHRAMHDVAGLPDLLLAMDPILPSDGGYMALAEACRPVDEVDRDGMFKRREDGEVVFAFGKNEGAPILSERGYLRWMLGADFSPEVKRIIRREMGGLGL